LVVRRPAAALAAPALVALLSPLWLLAPLTIACGFSIPPWVLGRLWGVGRDGGGAEAVADQPRRSCRTSTSVSYACEERIYLRTKANTSLVGSKVSAI